MAGWPDLGRVDERRLAQSARAGDANALAQIYDAYAARLFDYGHALLRDQEAASGALHDALIAAQEHIGRLREPERFRSWLYALVRSECVRRLADPDHPPRQREAAEEADDPFLDADERRRRGENRRLVQSALAGLKGRQREAVDLAVRHEMSAEEVAGVLGLSSQRAIDLVAGARGDLDDTLAAAIIARTGRSDCPSVAALVNEREWPLPPEVCRTLVRHIGSCPVCADRRKRKVSTNRLLRVLPVTALPVGLRAAVLGLASAPDGHEARTLIGHAAEPLDAWGWPATASAARGRRPAPPRLWPAVAAAAAVVFVVGGLFLVAPTSADKGPGGHDRRPAAAPTPSEETGGSDPAASPTPSPTSSSPAPKATQPTPTPTRTRPRHRPRQSISKRPSPRPGVLSVSGCTIEVGETSCAITIRARGGTVRWSVTGSRGVSAHGSGTLAAGRSGTVRAERIGACTPGEVGTVSFTPSGSATVSWVCE